MPTWPRRGHDRRVRRRHDHDPGRLLDDRIAVVGPSCCLTPLADLDIAQCYAGCPETHMWRRYAEGVDEVDLLCAAAPKPMPADGGRVRRGFPHRGHAPAGGGSRGFLRAPPSAADRFEFYVDPAGHCYSLAQARRFARFMNRWLRGTPGPPVPELAGRDFPRSTHTTNCAAVRAPMSICGHSPAIARRRLKGNGIVTLAAIRAAAARPRRRDEPPPPQPRSCCRPPVSRVDAPLAASAACGRSRASNCRLHFCYADRQPAPAICTSTMQGRNRLLYRHGLLAQAVDFLDRDAAARFGVEPSTCAAGAIARRRCVRTRWRAGAASTGRWPT